MAQTKEQQKRGIIVPPAPTPSPGSMKSGNPGNRPELILQTGHTRSINAVAFSPDNRWLASGGKDNVIKIWGFNPAKRKLAGFRFHNQFSYSKDLNDPPTAVGGISDCLCKAV